MIWHDNDSSERASSFRQWMTIRAYSEHTIDGYVGALANTVSKLIGVDTKIHRNLFLYSALTEFEVASKQITTAQNFKTINKGDHGTLAAALKRYKEFLINEQNQKELKVEKSLSVPSSISESKPT